VTGAVFVRGDGWGVATGAAESQTCTTTCQEGSEGAEPGQFGAFSPTRVAVDKHGSVYVIDKANSRVQKFDSLGDPVATFATAQLSSGPTPTDIAVNPVNDHVLVVKPCSVSTCPTGALPEEIHVLEFDSGGTLLETDGENAGIPANSADGSAVRGLAIAPTSGNIYLFWSRPERMYVLNNLVLPTLSLEPATDIAAGEATLHATVNPNETTPNEIETEYQFEYSSDGVNWQKAPTSPGKIVAGTSAVPISQTITGLESHTIYQVRLHAEKQFAAGSETSAIVEFTTGEAAPSVAGGVVSNVESSAALLTAQVNPKGLDTTYHFEYGTSPAYGASLPAPDADAGSGVGAVVVEVHPEGLLAGTLYYYRVVAGNGLGEGETTGTFTTVAATLPGALTGAASGVTQNTATISGTINSEGQSVSYGFEIGTSAGDYGPPTGLGAVGAGLNEAPVALSLAGLLPDTTYYYRIEASDVNGISYGAEQTFATQAFANAFATPPAALPFVGVPAISFPPETGAETKSTTKALTNAQKLAAALKACKKQPKKKRAKCAKQARKKYPPAKTKKAKKK
jgi:NHL repeat